MFHKDCESSIVNFDEVEGVYNGLKEIQSLWFVKLELGSIEEAKARAFSLGVITYNTNTNTFVRLYTKS